ncbi:hypothetical protein AMECASPLE_033647 [Ameca splendens]|uniref:Uncharacterized protein n=1 Tax=Ameca splendens TaxID=208324 RepID=A0ABV0XJV5_9TELE
MLSVTSKTNVLSVFFLPVNEDSSSFPRPSPLSPPVAFFIFFLSPSTRLVLVAPFHPPSLYHFRLPPSLQLPPPSPLPASPTRYSSLVLLQSPTQLSDPLPLSSLAP